jgi:signal transduction histidine kinase
LMNANAGLRWLDRDSPDLNEVRETLRRITRDGSRAGEIVARIRAMAKKAPPQKDPLNLNDIIVEVIAMVSSELEQNRVLLQTKLLPDLPSIFGDKIQLQQVLLNLLINAIEAVSELDEGPRELSVTSQKVNEVHGEAGKEVIEGSALTGPESAFVLIAVRDSGPGLSATAGRRVFEPFYTSKSEGMGMGLAICRSIIEAHHGDLWVTANPPRGAVFQFTVPI